jgi:hypothetical protein
MGSKRITIVIFVLALGKMSAQVPGYMGKRLMLGYSNNFFVTASGPTARTNEAGFNTTHCFNLEYTIKNRTNLCASFQMFNTGTMLNKNIEVSGYDPASQEYLNYTYMYSPVGDEPIFVSTKTFGIGFKFFPTGSLAPLGKYKKLELLLLFSDVSYSNNSFIINENYQGTYSRGTIGAGEYTFKTFALAYTLGRQRVLFDRIVLDYGIQFALLPAGFFATLNGDEDFYSNSTIESNFRSVTNARLFRYNIFNFHLGLGLLTL